MPNTVSTLSLLADSLGYIQDCELYILHPKFTSGIELIGREDWQSQLEGIPGFAVRSFDTREAAEQAYRNAMLAGLVERIHITGERRTLTEDDLDTIPSFHSES